MPVQLANGSVRILLEASTSGVPLDANPPMLSTSHMPTSPALWRAVSLRGSSREPTRSRRTWTRRATKGLRSHMQ